MRKTFMYSEGAEVSVRYVIKRDGEFYYAAKKLKEARERAKIITEHNKIENKKELITIEKNVSIIQKMKNTKEELIVVNESF